VQFVLKDAQKTFDVTSVNVKKCHKNGEASHGLLATTSINIYKLQQIEALHREMVYTTYPSFYGKSNSVKKRIPLKKSIIYIRVH